MPHRVGANGYQKILGVYIDVSQGGGLGKARMCIIAEVAGKVVFQPLSECSDEGLCRITGIGGMTPEQLNAMVDMMHLRRKIA